MCVLLSALTLQLLVSVGSVRELHWSILHFNDCTVVTAYVACMCRAVFGDV